MAESEVSICNMAIGKIGVSMFIADLWAERSNEARTCRVFYGAARDRTLAESPWGFATRIADLQSIGSPPSGWLYRYRYPNDCLKARAVVIAGMSVDGEGLPFRVVEDEANGGKAILTNYPSAVLVYTARITNTKMFSALFDDAFSWALAADIASPLSAAPGMAESARQAYISALGVASAGTLNEGKQVQDQQNQECQYLSVRN